MGGDCAIIVDTERTDNGHIGSSVGLTGARDWKPAAGTAADESHACQGEHNASRKLPY